MSYSREAIRRDMDSMRVDVIVRTDDQYGHIPFKTDIKGRDMVVYEHSPLIEEAQGSYIVDLEPEDVRSSFVAISVANSLMRRRLEMAKVNQVVKFYTPLSNPDSLSRIIFEDIVEGVIETSDGEFLLSALHGNDIVSDVARINAIRLAKNVAINSNKISRSLEISGKTSLNFLLGSGRKSYDEVLMAFGNDSPLERARLFAGSIQESMIALAFPMQDSEADRFLELMPDDL